MEYNEYQISRSIEIPVGTVITVLGKKVICVADDGVYQSCEACPLRKFAVCELFCCGVSRSDKKNTHFEDYKEEGKEAKQ